MKGTPLRVSYEEKDVVKALGAGWDPALRAWYVPPGRDLRPFQPWVSGDAERAEARRRTEPQATAELLGAPPELHLWTPAFVHVGQNAGSEMDQVLGNVTRKVCVVSPYLTPSLLDRLHALQSRGVAVSLVTSAQGIQDRRDISHRLVRQEQHLNVEGQARRRRRMRQAVSTAAGLMVAAVAGAFIHPLALLLLLGMPLPALAFLWFYSTAIFSYSYHPAFARLRVVASPFIHSKLYVIDDELAYVGSLNFTAAGLRSNFETSVRVDDAAGVQHLARLVDLLFEEQSWVERTPDMVAADLRRRGLFREPAH